ncbi:MAG TPA: hypothetical protein VJO33_11105 [Gemmatimonadaceae bacterium]|nr:hypothetical protein [Gemmatimonadaceae bacterium]
MNIPRLQSARLIAAFACVATAACATGTGPANSHFFLERSYVGPVVHDDTLLYEAQAAAHIFLLDDLNGAFAKISQDPSRDWSGAFRIIMSPMFLIRQLNDSSSAVRTPSFMPQLSVEYLYVSRMSDATGPAANLRFSPVLVRGLRLTLAHHSNGQAGCFREGFEPIDRHANVCVPEAGFDTNIVKLNRANGDFSTTYLQAMVHTTIMNRAAGDRPTHTFGLAAAYDYHLRGIFGALSDEQRQLYGSWRTHLMGEAMQVIGSQCNDGATRPWNQYLACQFQGRARVSAEYVRGPRNPGPLALRINPPILPWSDQLEFSYTFNALLGTGLFVRWHDGQDYYNINFVNRRRVFMYGIMLDASALPRIGPAVH